MRITPETIDPKESIKFGLEERQQLPSAFQPWHPVKVKFGEGAEFKDAVVLRVIFDHTSVFYDIEASFSNPDIVGDYFVRLYKVEACFVSHRD